MSPSIHSCPPPSFIRNISPTPGGMPLISQSHTIEPEDIKIKQGGGNPYLISNHQSSISTHDPVGMVVISRNLIRGPISMLNLSDTQLP